MNYYEQQLNQLNKPNAPVKIKLSGSEMSGDMAQTNWMNLNHESINALRDFLDVVESELD